MNTVVRDCFAQDSRQKPVELKKGTVVEYVGHVPGAVKIKVDRKILYVAQVNLDIK